MKSIASFVLGVQINFRKQLREEKVLRSSSMVEETDTG